MIYDIRTSNTAYETFYHLINVQTGQFLRKVVLEYNNDIEKYLYTNEDYLKTLDISNWQYRGFHVTSSCDNCNEIKKLGIKSLRKVLMEDTLIRKFLLENGFQFDLQSNIMIYNGKSYDVNYNKYKDKDQDEEELLADIAYRLCYDSQINGFFSCSDVKQYGTSIHLRPEFFIKLEKFSPNFTSAIKQWIEITKSYLVNFVVNFNQIEWFTFYDEEYQYENDSNNNFISLKRKLITMAYYRMNDFINSNSDKAVYLKKECDIYPEQIISCEIIN